MSRKFTIQIYGVPILNKKTACVSSIGEEERGLFDAMARIMRSASGVGLAANQIGVDKQMLVIDVGEGLIKIANPKIMKKQGRQIQEEGCLSLPDVIVKVSRAKDIVIEGLDENNRKIKLNAQDLLARVLQHEVDHLNGKLIIDYASWHIRSSLRKKLRNLKKRR